MIPVADPNGLVWQIQCNYCQNWFPQDRADADALDTVFWAQHQLDVHPKREVALLLDAIMLDAILSGDAPTVFEGPYDQDAP